MSGCHCFFESGICPDGGGPCKCYIEYNGTNCQGYQITFGILFPLVVIAAVLVLVRIPKKLHIHYGIFSMISFFGIVRTLYLWLDPHGIRRYSRVFNNILYGLGVWALLAVLLFIVSLWIYIVHASKFRANRMKKLLVGVYVAIIVFFFLHLMFDLLRVYFNIGGARIVILGTYFLVVAIFVIVPSILYLVYGRRLYREIRDSSKATNRSSSHLKKATFLTTAITIICLSLVAFFIVIMGIASINDTKELFLGTHTVYRILEFLYCAVILGVFHVKFKKSKHGSTVSANQETHSKVSQNSSN